jgi:hypothetical protein
MLAEMCGTLEEYEGMSDRAPRGKRRKYRPGPGGGAKPPAEKRYLSADWTEALMGYPRGWTDIEKEDVSHDTDFPAAWLDGSWEDGILRTAPKTENRRRRLKCLGNAVVPQIPMMIWTMIKELL